MTPDDPLKALDAALGVRPSAGFSAGVRQRVARESAPRVARRRIRGWAVVMAATAAAVVVGIVLRAPAGAPPLEPAMAKVAPATPASVVRPPAEIALVGPRRAVAGGVADPQALARAHPPGAASGPAVLVPKGQAQALNALITAARRGDIDSRQFATPADPTAIDPIVIAPIVVPPLDTADGGAASGGDRVGAGGGEHR